MKQECQPLGHRQISDVLVEHKDWRNDNNNLPFISFVLNILQYVKMLMNMYTCQRSRNTLGKVT